MNYLILKNIIESTLTHFKCKNCNSTVTEGNINILWTAWNSINMEIICPKCKTTWIAKAEIWLVGTIKTWEIEKTQINKTNIQDSDIISLRESLKNCDSLNDLFK